MPCSSSSSRSSRAVTWACALRNASQASISCRLSPGNGRTPHPTGMYLHMQEFYPTLQGLQLHLQVSLPLCGGRGGGYRHEDIVESGGTGLSEYDGRAAAREAGNR